MTNDPMTCSVGDFAKLCNTTVATLLHYESFGLLTPALVKSNGWRFYDRSQYFTYHMIRALKDCGCSLTEIKTYLNEPDLHKNYEILAERLEAIDADLARLRQTRRQLCESLKALGEALACEPFDQASTRYLEEEYIIVEQSVEESPAFDGNSPNIKTIRDRLAAHSQYCATLDSLSRFLPSVLYSREDFFSHNYNRPLAFQTVSDPVECEMLHVKPAGEYLLLTNRGRWPGSFVQVVSRVEEELGKLDATLNGDVYVYPLKAGKSAEDDALQILYQVQIHIVRSSESR